MLEITHREKYVNDELLGKIISYIDERNDDFMGGPIVDKSNNSSSLGMEGCSDRPLRLDVQPKRMVQGIHFFRNLQAQNTLRVFR